MKKIEIRINRGSQYYLYDCCIIPENRKPFMLCENAFFGELIDCLSFLINPQRWECFDDGSFAKELLSITQRECYTFSVLTDDIENYIEFINTSKS